MNALEKQREKTMDKFCDYLECHYMDPYDKHFEELTILEEVSRLNLIKLYNYYDHKLEIYVMKKLERGL